MGLFFHSFMVIIMLIVLKTQVINGANYLKVDGKVTDGIELENGITLAEHLIDHGIKKL